MDLFGALQSFVAVADEGGFAQHVAPAEAGAPGAVANEEGFSG